MENHYYLLSGPINTLRQELRITKLNIILHEKKSDSRVKKGWHVQKLNLSSKKEYIHFTVGDNKNTNELSKTLENFYVKG